MLTAIIVLGLTFVLWKLLGAYQRQRRMEAVFTSQNIPNIGGHSYPLIGSYAAFAIQGNAESILALEDKMPNGCGWMNQVSHSPFR
jgi:hypothetical protein